MVSLYCSFCADLKQVRYIPEGINIVLTEQFVVSDNAWKRRWVHRFRAIFLSRIYIFTRTMTCQINLIIVEKHLSLKVIYTADIFSFNFISFYIYLCISPLFSSKSKFGNHSNNNNQKKNRVWTSKWRIIKS